MPNNIKLLNDDNYSIRSASYDSKTKKLIAAGENNFGDTLLVYNENKDKPIIVSPPVIKGMKIQAAPALVYAYEGKGLVIGANVLFKKSKNVNESVAYTYDLEKNQVDSQIIYPGLVTGMNGQGSQVYLTSLGLGTNQDQLIAFNMNSDSWTAQSIGVSSGLRDMQMYGGEIYGLAYSKRQDGDGFSVYPISFSVLDKSTHKALCSYALSEKLSAYTFDPDSGVAYIGYYDDPTIVAYNVKSHTTKKIHIIGYAATDIETKGDWLVVTSKEGITLVNIARDTVVGNYSSQDIYQAVILTT